MPVRLGKTVSSVLTPWLLVMDGPATISKPGGGRADGLDKTTAESGPAGFATFR